MKIVQASTKRVYETETKPIVRLLSSGIKLSGYMMDKMGLEPGNKVSYAKDEENDNRLYLFNSGEEGSIIGKNNAFTNSGLVADMKALAGKPALEIKGGNHIVFTMDEEGTEFDGVTYFGMDLDTVEIADKPVDETAEEATEEVVEDSFE